MTELWKSPTKDWSACSEKRQEQLYHAWNAGELRWKLDPVQRRAVDDVYAGHAKAKSSMERIHVLEFTRRGGKDFCMSTIAIMEAMRNRRRIRIPYAAPTKENCKDIVIPTFEEIFRDCPPELLPYEIKNNTFRRSAMELNWDWGAQIQLVGVDLHPEWLRGTNTHVGIMTEPGFMDGLEHLMKSILLPQLLTSPDGFIVMGSTPPITPGHYWSTNVVRDAQLRGMYTKATIFDFKERLGEDQINGLIEATGGLKSTQCRRELFCEHVTEATNMVVPEFADVKAQIVTEKGFDKPPQYRDTYVSLDPGFAHATGAVFGYYDYETALFMIEGCFKTQGLNSAEVARRVKAREWQLWGRKPQKPSKLTEAAWAAELEAIRSHFYPNLREPPTPVVTISNGQVYTKTYRRVSDTDSRLIADMANEHDLLFFATEKTDSEAHMNNFRLNVQRLRYRIHPRCVELITDVEQAVWNKARTKIAEGPGGHHYDTLPASVYLNRNILWGRNPFPATMPDPRTHHVPAGTATEKTRGALLSAFGRRRR